MGFRPLAGMSCFSTIWMNLTKLSVSFRPLAGMSCFMQKIVNLTPHTSFRPLAGMSCFRANGFPSPRGDELFRMEDGYISAAV